MYSYVSFSNVRYSEVVESVRRQNNVLNWVGGVVGMAGLVGVGVAMRRLRWEGVREVVREVVGLVKGFLKT